MESTIYKPSIYKGAGIYNNGAGGGGGGGPYPKLVYRDDDSDKNTGWRFGSNCCMTGEAGKYAINTGLATYALCPYINNAKSIYVKYKLNFSTAGGGQYRILDTDFDESFRLFTNWIYSDYRISFYLKNGSTSVYSWEDYIRISTNNDYKFEHLLDVENGIITTKVNDITLINQNIDISLLNLKRYIPAFGMVPNYSYSYLPNGLKFYRNEFTYKIDDVEQIPQETLE